MKTLAFGPICTFMGLGKEDDELVKVLSFLMSYEEQRPVILFGDEPHSSACPLPVFTKRLIEVFGLIYDSLPKGNEYLVKFDFDTPEPHEEDGEDCRAGAYFHITYVEPSGDGRQIDFEVDYHNESLRYSATAPAGVFTEFGYLTTCYDIDQIDEMVKRFIDDEDL